MYLMDSSTTNTMLRETKYFQTLTKLLYIILSMGTQTIANALLYPNSTRTLLSYRDIHKNGLHIVTHEENNEESLLGTKTNIANTRNATNILARRVKNMRIKLA
jgi:hypothetical protein